MRFLIAIFCAVFLFGSVQADEPQPLTLVVMDPLSKPLACDCVQGYAQRKYEKLGEYLQATLKRPVKVVWSESLTKSLEENGPAHIIIGKESVVRHDAKIGKLKLRPLARLTGLDSSTTQTGLFVVRKDDAAQSVKDLAGYRIFFGPKDCDEKHLAPMALLKEHDVALPGKIETAPACSSAAAKLMDLPADAKAAAVISSYAQPLLAGCGAIKKGDLRVVGESKPVGFVTAFVNRTIPKDQAKALKTALLDVELEPELLTALETADGFKNYKPIPTPGKEADTATDKGSKKKASKKKTQP